jgi:hypothetical protein
LGTEEMPDTPVEPSSGAPYPGNVEARLAVLEHVTETNAKTFGRLERRFDAVDRRFEVIDRRFEAVERRFDAFDRRFDAIDRRFEAVDARFVAMDGRFEAIERRLDSIIHEHRADFRWLIGAMGAGFGTLLVVMAHGFHWF